MEINEEEFKEIKEKALQTYLEIGKVYCPYFKKEVVFDMEGFDHIPRRDKAHTRPIKDQIKRFKLLKYAPILLKSSHLVQGLYEAQEWYRLKSHGSWISKMKITKYYEFIAIINDMRLKVIVKENESGEVYFWSIIPFWRINKNTSRRILHNIDLDE